MTNRERLLTILLGIVGVVAAGAIALAANAISGDSIGLSVQPVSLASSGPAPAPAPGAKHDRGDDHRAGSGNDNPTTTEDLSAPNSGPGSGSSGDDSSSSGPSKGTSGGDRHSGSSPSGPSGTSGTSGSSGSGLAPVTTTTTDDHGGGGGRDGGGDGTTSSGGGPGPN